MKKIVLIALTLLLLTACSDDDKNSFNKKDIVNKWYIISNTSKGDTTDYSKGYIACETDYFEFSPNNKFSYTLVDQCIGDLITETDYSINGNQLTIGTENSTILELSKSQMKVEIHYRYFINPETPVIETAIITYKPVPKQ